MRTHIYRKDCPPQPFLPYSIWAQGSQFVSQVPDSPSAHSWWRGVIIFSSGVARDPLWKPSAWITEWLCAPISSSASILEPLRIDIWERNTFLEATYYTFDICLLYMCVWCSRILQPHASSLPSLGRSRYCLWHWAGSAFYLPPYLLHSVVVLCGCWRMPGQWIFTFSFLLLFLILLVLNLPQISMHFWRWI